MKHCLLIVVLAASCTSPEQKRIIRVGSDTLELHLDTQKVISSQRVPPRSIHEEVSPIYRIITDKDTFKRGTPVFPGDVLIFKKYQKISQ
jgi:hypothetical protein